MTKRKSTSDGDDIIKRIKKEDGHSRPPSSEADEADIPSQVHELPKELQAFIDVVLEYKSSSQPYKHAMERLARHLLKQTLERPEGPSIEQRVSRTEQALHEGKVSRKRIAKVMRAIRAEVVFKLKQALGDFSIKDSGSDEDTAPYECSDRDSSTPSPSGASPSGNANLGTPPNNKSETPAVITGQYLVREGKPNMSASRFMRLKSKKKLQAVVEQNFQNAYQLLQLYVRHEVHTTGSDDLEAVSTSARWKSFDPTQREAWVQLLAQLKAGDCDALSTGRDLLARQGLVRPSAAPIPPSLILTPPAGRKDHVQPDVERLKGSRPCGSGTVEQRDPTDQLPAAVRSDAEQAVCPDSFRVGAMFARWTVEEEICLARCMAVNMSDDDIAAALPSTTPRTAKAISVRKSYIRKMYAEGSGTIHGFDPMASEPAVSTATNQANPSSVKHSSPPTPSKSSPTLKTSAERDTINLFTNSGFNVRLVRLTPDTKQEGRKALLGPQVASSSSTKQQDSTSFNPPTEPRSHRRTQSMSRNTLVRQQGDADATPVKQHFIRPITRSAHAQSVSPEPTLVTHATRPPVTAENKDIEYLMLPINTPRCPVQDAIAEELTTACAIAFGRDSGFQCALTLGNMLWVATFKRPAMHPVNLRKLMKHVINYRGFQFKARRLSYGPPRTFVANITDWPDMLPSTLASAVGDAFQTRYSRPALALQTDLRFTSPGTRTVLAQFTQAPKLAEFYIPVQLNSARRWIQVCFEPLDMNVMCWSCGGFHRDGWCNKAVKLSSS